ncbi:hypothetical protein LEP1GSC194_2863 [Leptospira alstonii serovar Sichuan str. 79601]|uniref:Uncharacterized protein n=1 Tax=Leptospira alstonii serovar Sichuan str. 79601 TaxID=1218565 RepID=M6CGB1_9LEPT|nr:hypothetical protein LEP1GSC194_2863 [Leptospira alstonii serovar Sichuan str. 79601]
MGESGPFFSYGKKRSRTALSAPINKLKDYSKSEVLSSFQFVDSASIAFASFIPNLRYFKPTN